MDIPTGHSSGLEKRPSPRSIGDALIGIPSIVIDPWSVNRRYLPVTKVVHLLRARLPERTALHPENANPF